MDNFKALHSNDQQGTQVSEQRIAKLHYWAGSILFVVGIAALTSPYGAVFAAGLSIMLFALGVMISKGNGDREK